MHYRGYRKGKKLLISALSHSFLTHPPPPPLSLHLLLPLSSRISACNVEAAFSESIHQNYRPARSDFSKMSMISPTPNPSSSNDVTTIMEKALPNPSQEPSYTMTGLLKSCIHSGYLLMKRGDVTAGWKRRFFVLVGSHSTPQSSTTSTSSKRLLLYCFENETATHAREIIPVYGTCVYALHESFFETSNCFQLHVKACSSSSSISSSTFEDYNNTVNQDSSSTVMTTVYNFSAESQIQSYQWMECLKTGVRMVIADNDNNFTTIDERGNTITTSSLHSGDNKKVDYLEKFRRIRNIQVSISEAKNISRVFGGNSSNANAGVSGSGSSSSSSIFKNAIRSKQAAAAANAAAIMTQQQQQLLDTYMIVCLDNVKMAKTRPKQGDAPFWSESFTFE